MKNSSTKRLNAKDVITIGIHSVIIRVITMVLHFPFLPIYSIAVPFFAGVCALVTAPVYQLMAYKIGKRGVIFLFSTVTGLLYLLMGVAYMFPYLLVTGILCEVLMWKKDAYRHFWHNTAGFTLYSVLYLGATYFPIYMFGRDYFSRSGGYSTSDIGDTLAMYALSPLWVFISIVITALMAVAGCLIGRRLLRKHFIKSGLIQDSKSMVGTG